MFEITFLRHGESTGNVEGYFQGQSEYPLSEKGKEQSKALATRWQEEGVSFDKIICSPLSRAKQTAEIINTSIQSQIEFDPIWMERDYGILSGMRYKDFRERTPRPDFINLYDSIGETGESDWELFLRAGQALQRLFRQPPGKYLVVSHGGLLNKVINNIFGIKPQANFQGVRFRFNNTRYTKVSYSTEDNHYRIFCVNECAHIDNEKVLETPYQFILLRHGESEGNVQQIFQGQLDYPLSSKGREQAKALSDFWAMNKMVFDKIFTSPLLRARETAEIVGKGLGNLFPEDNELLKEVDVGKLSRLPVANFHRQYPVREDHCNPFIPIGETWYDLYLRTGKFIQSLMKKSPGKYLIVSHGGTINSFLWAALGIVPGVPNHTLRFHLENTSYAVLGYRPNENSWHLAKAGDQRHLQSST
ncbi:MAG: histidine phosphatase family protein [Anaerolineales bacterium]|jgi:broad specificity phosphatase PhoE